VNEPSPFAPGRPVVLRGGTVLTMDDRSTVLPHADVLVVGDRIAAVGPGLEVPEGAAVVDASGGVVMPGMIDTHRHMWQTAMRGYGADWTLTQYFVCLTSNTDASSVPRTSTRATFWPRSRRSTPA
jgi:5-methylthioadenosine/S-adenosylhomocysteine deaminase